MVDAPNLDTGKRSYRRVRSHTPPSSGSPVRPRVGELGGIVKLLALVRPSWQTEGDAGTEFKLRQQPR